MTKPFRSWPWLSALCLSLVAVGCPVDERSLLSDEGVAGASSTGNGNDGGDANLGGDGSAGSPAGGARAGGAGGLAEQGGAAGAQGDEGGQAGSLAQAGSLGSGGAGVVEPPPGVVDGCADLDFNEVADCEETLLANADFKQDLGNWLPDQAITQSWRNENAVSPPPSGSGLLANTGAVDADGFALAASAQCVPVASSQSVEIFVNVFIESGQGQGFAGVNVWFYDAADCQGPITANYTTPFASGVNDWLIIKGVGRASPSAQSMRVRLAIGKPFRDETFHALFDNVLVKAR